MKHACASARARCAALVLGLALPLSGCGGGIWAAWGDGVDDEPPSVVLVAGVLEASQGQVVRLAAAADDDEGVESVSFYRVGDDGREVLLGSDASAPYEWEATMPTTSAAEVQFFARAVDVQGERTDSERVAVRVLR